MELSNFTGGAGRGFPQPYDGPSGTSLRTKWEERARKGDFRGAWQVSDRALEVNRYKDFSGAPEHLRPVWNGQRLDGKRVLVRCFHGLGDTIQFARFIPRLAEVAADVVVHAQDSLVDLLEPLSAKARIISRREPTPNEYDVEIEIMELAHAFRTELDTIPTNVPYITARPIPVYGESALKVGLVWQAGDWDDRRSIPFQPLRPWSDTPGVEFYSLQLDPVAAGWHNDFGQVLDAWSVVKTAGLMCSLDLIISVDTMAAHLAGALGRPVWTLLKADADWRWMQNRSDSPWYPTLGLFRQSRQGDWSDVVESVRNDLLALSEETIGGGDRNRTDE